MKARRFLLFTLAIALYLCPILAAEPSGEENTASNVLAQFQIAKDGAPIILPVKLKGEEYPFLLDTGLTAALYDVSLRSHLEEPVGTELVGTPDGNMRIETYPSPDASLGKMSLKTDGYVICEDLTQLRQMGGVDIYGIIGMDFLSNYVVQIDFDKGSITFMKSIPDPESLLVVNAHPEWGEPVDIDYASWKSPIIEARVADSTNSWFIIDTGYIGTGDFTNQLFERLSLKGRITEISDRLFASAVGTFRHTTGKTEDISLGSFNHKGLHFGKSTMSILGLSYLSRYKVTLDFPNNTLYLQKGKRFSEPDNPDFSGLNLWRIDKHITVHSVEDNSPAKISGIQKDDVILSINGTNINELDLFSIRRLLCQRENKKIELIIRRNDTEIAKSFKLKNYHLERLRSSPNEAVLDDPNSVSEEEKSGVLNN